MRDELGVLVSVEVRSCQQRVPRALIECGVDDDGMLPSRASVQMELRAQNVRVQRQLSQMGRGVEAAQPVETFLAAALC